MQATIEMLVVASSPTITEGLESLALTLPHVAAVYTASFDPQSLPKPDDATPSLILLDCTLPLPECQEMLALVKRHWPQSKAVVLVDTEAERRQLDGTGIGVILLKGVPAVRLLAILKELLHAARHL